MELEKAEVGMGKTRRDTDECREGWKKGHDEGRGEIRRREGIDGSEPCTLGREYKLEKASRHYK